MNPVSTRKAQSRKFHRHVHVPLHTCWIFQKMCLPCLIIVQSCYFHCRRNKLFKCSHCVICVSCSVHLISKYYVSKGSQACILITHNSMGSENPVTFIVSTTWWWFLFYMLSWFVVLTCMPWWLSRFRWLHIRVLVHSSQRLLIQLRAGFALPKMVHFVLSPPSRNQKYHHPLSAQKEKPPQVRAQVVVLKSSKSCELMRFFTKQSSSKKRLQCIGLQRYTGAYTLVHHFLPWYKYCIYWTSYHDIYNTFPYASTSMGLSSISAHPPSAF